MRRRKSCACTNEVPGDGTATQVVHLVHGTFARHGGWLQPGSGVREAVEVPGTEVRVHCWTGANLQRDRERAGDDLRTALLQAVAERPQAEHLVVAHSHGGNVALYALRDQPELDGVKVITLATPFLSLSPGPRVGWFHVLAYLVMLVVGPLLLMGLYFGDPEKSGGSGDVGFLVTLAAIVPLGLVIYSARRDPASRRTWAALRGATLSGRAPKVTARGLREDRLLVVCAAGDEAGSLLGVSHLLAWLGNAAMLFVASLAFLAGWRRFLGAVLTAIIGLFGLLIALGLATRSSDATGTGIAVLIFVVVSLPVLVVALGNLPFGLDTLHLGLVGRMRAEATPEGTSRVLQVPPAQTSSLIHGIYQNPAVLELLRQRVERQASDSSVGGPE